MNEDLKFYNNADYLPPFLPFVIGTVEVGLMLIATFMYISKSLIQWKLTINLAETGQRTLTHYSSHLTIGMILFTIITNRQFDGKMNMESPVYPVFIFEFTCGYFILSYYFSKFWT